MKEVYDFLKNKTNVNFVATINGDKPSNRPFCDPVLFENKIYFITDKEKQVSKQICMNNNVCIVAYDSKDNNWIRIDCKLIDDSDSKTAKQEIISQVEWAEDNSNLQIFCLSDVYANIYDIDGNIISNYRF